MGTYISHFRNTDLLLKEFQNLETEPFLFGSLAPDSGIPNQDWTEFNPSRRITHFLSSAKSEGNIGDMDFYRHYLVDLSIREDRSRFSFLLGYFIHLICDNLWSLWIVVPTLKHNETLIREGGAEAWQIIKADWHDLDRKYFYEHPDLKIWQLLKPANSPTVYLPFLHSEGTLQQLDYIENVYLALKHADQLDRPYPFLNEASMDRFVSESTQIVLELLEQKDRLRQCDHQSALSLLDPERLLPFENLGDVL